MGAIIISSTYFNPRSPRGERRSVSVRHVQLFIFQSTLPAGGATFCFRASRSAFYISIHAPRGGSDVLEITPMFATDEEFQSTLPAGGATIVCDTQAYAAMISIHAPRGGSDMVYLS